MTDIPISFELTQEPFPNIDLKNNGAIYIKNPQVRNNIKSNGKPNDKSIKGRKRANSQSQVISLPSKPKITSTTSNITQEFIPKRNKIQYYVTLLPLNDTFVKKHLPVAIYPETTKLGRPTGTKHKPDITNGYFDSRVLSRNHAQIYIDSNSGKLMLQDLGSSNGTYLNDLRLNNDPVEVKVGDVVCLGFNVQAESTHKQISLKIEKINVISNGESEDDMFDSLTNGLLKYEELNTIDFKHLSFIEELYRQINETPNTNTNTKTKTKKKSEVGFDSALFGDVNSNIEDNLLGLYSSTNSGIYNNSQITNTTALENIISILVINLSRVKQQNSFLNTLENYLINYHQNLKELNRNFLNDQFKLHLTKLENELTKERTNNQVLKEKLTSIEQEYTEKIDILTEKLHQFEEEQNSTHIQIENYKAQINQYKLIKTESENTINKLEQECQVLKHSLQLHQQEEEQEEVNTAINGFIMDLSRTPSVRDRKVEHENSDKVSIELTPPVSDDEKEEEQPPPDQTQNSNSTIDLHAEISNTYSDDVEPFPKVDERKMEQNIEQRMLKDNEDIQQVKTIAIVISGVLIGYFLRRVTG